MAKGFFIVYRPIGKNLSKKIIKACYTCAECTQNTLLCSGHFTYLCRGVLLLVMQKLLNILVAAIALFLVGESAIEDIVVIAL
jgi:hypothetical protein